MKKFNFFSQLLISAVIFCCQSVYANTIKNEDVSRYLTLSGASKALAAVPAQIQAMGQQVQLTAQDPQQSQQALDKVMASWQFDEVEQIVFDHVKNNLTAEELQQLLNWLNTDLVRNIKQAEEQASDPMFNQNFMMFMADIQSNPPAAERAKLIREFVASTKMVDHTMDMVMKIADGFSKKLQADGIEQAKQDEFDAQMETMSQMMRPSIEQQMILVSHFLYQNIAEQDMAQYINFYQQALGQKELSVMYSAIGKALSVWSEKMLDDIKAEFANR